MNYTAGGICMRGAAARLISVAVMAAALAFPQARAGVNKALRFDGTGDYVRLPVHHQVACPVTDFTVEFWMKVGTGGYVFGAWKYINITASAASARLTIWPDDTETRFTVPITDYSDQWMYLAFVRQETTLTCYANGSAVSSMTAPAGSFGIFSGWGGQHIGSGPIENEGDTPSSCFGGMLDEFRISNTARSTAEMLASWNDGNGTLLQADTSTLALWHFDEGEGGMLHDVTMWNNGWRGWYASGDTACMPAWDDGIQFPGATGDFALYTPNFHARLGVPVLAVITGAAATDKFLATLTGPGVTWVVCAEDGPLPVELRFTMDLRDLAAGEYTITAQLLDADDGELKTMEKTFNKLHDGVPEAGIDEYNALVVDGKQVFPFGAFHLYEDRMPTWAQNGYVNCQNGTAGFGTTTFPTTLDICAQEGIGMIGGAGTWDTDTLTDIVNGSKDHGSMWAWGLPDEPALHGIDAATVIAASDAIHAADPQHPSWVNYMGHPYRTESAYWANVALGNSFPNLVADMYCVDYYPVMVTTDNGGTTFEEEIATLADKVCDHVRDWNYDLVPVHSYVECTQFDSDHPAPTAGQIRLITWVNIIHGIKGIMWFPWHWISSITDESYTEMARLCSEANRLAPVIFKPNLSGVVVEEELSGGRVDIMSKECNDSIYIFAANMKDQAEACRFTLEASLTGGSAAVFDSSLTIPLTGRTFTDTLPPFSVRIYSVPGTTAPVAVRPEPDGHILKTTVRPNPFSMTDGPSMITFTSPSSSPLTVTVTTLAGGSVWQGMSATGGNISWDVGGTTGERAASGVYLYTVTDESGGRCAGRLFIR